MIFINGRFLEQPVTGVQRYSIELLNALDKVIEPAGKQISDAGMCCLTSKKIASSPAWKNIPVQKSGPVSGNLWEQAWLPLLPKKQLLFSPANIGPYVYKNQVVTIHDSSVFAVPYAYSFTFRLKYTTIINRLARTARKVITDSVFSKTELVRYCHIPENKIEVIYLGHEHILQQPPDESVFARFGIGERPYFLAVGSNSLHKNFATAMQAFENAGFEDVDFVITGGDFSKVFRASSSSTSKNVIKTGYISDSQLRALYNRALGLVYPSYYEGFGLPPLEAMACGCPVVCSDAASLPEVCGDAAIYCAPNDTAGFMEQMKALASDPALREQLRQKGLLQAKKFSWKTTANQTWEVLQQAQAL